MSKIILLFLICIGLFGCIRSGNTPEEMFQYTLFNPIPKYVSNISGEGDTWQGYSINLSFSASAEFEKALIVEKYTYVECDSVSNRIDLPIGIDFKLFFDITPASEYNYICLKNENIENSWTHSGEHYILIEPKNYVVYFKGIGA